MAVSGYDGMRIICEALRAREGDTGGEALLKAMKGLSLKSPRGRVVIDEKSREPVQNIYLRKVERRGEEIVNAEFETIEAVRDPNNSRAEH